MKVMNRLFEAQKISKYSKYINSKLVPTINKNLRTNFIPETVNVDAFTQRFETSIDEDGSYTDMLLQFTTNRRDLDGLFWGTFIIYGRKAEIGSLTGDLDYDSAIVEDSYYELFDQAERTGSPLPRYQ